MSTLEECVRANLLVKLGGNLRPHQQEHRLLVMGAEALKDMRERLPLMKTDGFIEGADSPLNQAAALIHLFISGEDFDEPVPHQMSPLGQGVWRLRTADLRFDGWFPQTNFFVIGAFDHKQETLRPGRNAQMYQQVLDLRSSTKLLDGRFADQEDYRELVRL